MSITQRTATEWKHLLHRREISSQEIVGELFHHIEKEDPKLKAFLTLCPEKALAQAKASDERRAKGEALGLLEGIPIALKDNICTKGIPTTCGSRMLENFRPPYDAHVVERLEAEGAIVLGKTNLDEFAMGSSTENSAYFTTRNPYNERCVPGGSSGGSACAVASGMAPLALGSDTGGSVRQPAALCGIWGLKPTYGRVSRYGLIAFASSLDVIGPMARSLEDTGLLLEAIAGNDPRDSTSLDQPVPCYRDGLKEKAGSLKIGIPQEYFLSEMDSDVQKCIQLGIETLRRAGATIVDVSLPLTPYAIPTYYLIATAEASANLSRYDGIHYGFRANANEAASAFSVGDISLLESLYMQSRGEALGEEVKRRILLGTYVLSSGYYEAWYLKALEVRSLLRAEMQKVFEEVDLLLTPTSPLPAFPCGEKTDDPLSMYLCDIFTVTFNLTGHPALSVPCGFTSAGLPVGLQLVGRMLEEKTLFSAAHPLSFPH